MGLANNKSGRSKHSRAPALMMEGTSHYNAPRGSDVMFGLCQSEVCTRSYASQFRQYLTDAMTSPQSLMPSSVLPPQNYPRISGATAPNKCSTCPAHGFLCPHSHTTLLPRVRRNTYTPRHVCGARLHSLAHNAARPTCCMDIHCMHAPNRAGPEQRQTAIPKRTSYPCRPCPATRVSQSCRRACIRANGAAPTARHSGLVPLP